MSKSIEKMQAIELRRRGFLLKDIASQLNVSRSSVITWCSSVTYTEQEQRVIRQNALIGGSLGRLAGAASNRKKKEQRVSQASEQAQKMVGSISHRDLLMLGIGLYWGEGVKSSGTKVAVVNSDPYVIALMKRWFIECLDVDESRFRPVIFINAIHQSREAVLLTHWSKVLGLDAAQFGKTVFLTQRPKKLYENHDSYYGMVALRVAQPAEIKYKVLGMLECVAKEVQTSRGSSGG